MLRYIDTILKKRTSYQKLLQFSVFNDRRVYIKMKRKDPYVTRRFQNSWDIL